MGRDIEKKAWKAGNLVKKAFGALFAREGLARSPWTRENHKRNHENNQEGEKYAQAQFLLNAVCHAKAKASDLLKRAGKELMVKLINAIFRYYHR